MWKDTTTRPYDDKYKELRAKALARDKVCRYPGCKKRSHLQVHHIIRWADSGEFRYSLSNVICLCRQHHNKVKNKEHLYSEMFFEIVRNINGRH